MKIYVDIDETICYYTNKEQRLGYKKAIPLYENINKINKLYDEGHFIKYWTSRGHYSKIDYNGITLLQLKKWKCKFHELSVGDKPIYDLLICDKTKRIEEI
jgi:hypothetical protein